MDKKEKTLLSSKHIIFACLTMLMLIGYVLFCPQPAFAQDAPFDFSSIIGQLQNIVTWFLLPLAIVWVSWKLLYLAVVVGIFGYDPLNYCTAAGEAAPSYSTLMNEIKIQLVNFVKGICWIGGIFIIFQLVVVLASTIAGVFGEAFG